jgi:phospholipid/cholesterol/gamma-HCH transport system permease protein
LTKSLVFAFLIASVGCYRGLRNEQGAQGVGLATTAAVVNAIFLIIVTDTLLTWVFTMLSSS